MMKRVVWLLTLAACAFSAGCEGEIGVGGGDEDPSNIPPGGTDDEAASSGLRRLSIDEYRRSVETLIGIDPDAARELLPEDARAPFDNIFEHQVASGALIGGYELLAGDLAEALVADDALFARIVPCEATGPDDGACFAEFLRTFGRRALRRALTAEEVTRYGTLIEHGALAGDFRQAVNAGLRLFLQHPEFLYRVEIGRPVEDRPGVVQLTGHEIATRLSYFMLGDLPPDWLLDAAEAGDLDAPAGIALAATRLMDEVDALARFVRFHGMLFGYERLSTEGIFGDMHQETRALVERVVFSDERPWTDLLLSGDTYVTARLAEHYGLAPPDVPEGEADWVSYGESGRRGLFSHGTFLSAVPKFGDTSPTQRGLLIRTQLFCQHIPEPSADLMVDVDEPPSSGDPDACKADNYFMAQDERCSVCHEAMDYIGFGLENFDQTGQYRDHENGREDCDISGDGEFLGVGEFNGPAELAQLSVDSGLVEVCMARQLYRFAHGRDSLDIHDEAFLRRAAQESGSEFVVRDFITELVTSDAFRLRRESEEEVSP